MLTDSVPIKVQIAVDAFCRQRGIKFVSADVCGPWCRVFNDFGDAFEVIDKNGDDPVEVMIKNITIAEKSTVTLLPGARHPYEDGEHIVLSEITGMNLVGEAVKQEEEEEIPIEKPAIEQGSINQTIHKVQVINSNSFFIGDTRKYTPYVRNGLAKNIKTPLTLAFKSLSEIVSATGGDFAGCRIDAGLSIHDFEKIDNPNILFIAFLALDDFMSASDNLALPRPWHVDDTGKFLTIAETHINKFYDNASKEPKSLREVLMRFALTVGGTVGPFAAFVGGLVSQEIVKAITNKFIPTNQLFFSDCMEVICDSGSGETKLSIANYPEFITANYEKEFKLTTTRDDGIRSVIGNTTLEKVKAAKLFMVGCGAIGCELLKNFAMISLSTGESGMITITDPDHIEVSNLNRQFLFREKHLRKPKS